MHACMMLLRPGFFLNGEAKPLHHSHGTYDICIALTVVKQASLQT